MGMERRKSRKRYKVGGKASVKKVGWVWRERKSRKRHKVGGKASAKRADWVWREGKFVMREEKQEILGYLERMRIL